MSQADFKVVRAIFGVAMPKPSLDGTWIGPPVLLSLLKLSKNSFHVAKA